MKTKPSKPFIVPGEYQGQHMECAYSIDYESEVIIERIHDKGDNSIRYDAYAYPTSGEEFEPWNGAPVLGIHLGECTISTIPNEVREARLGLGLTQKEFGELLHAKLRTVQDWEAGKRNMQPVTRDLLWRIMTERGIEHTLSAP